MYKKITIFTAIRGHSRPAEPIKFCTIVPGSSPTWQTKRQTGSREFFLRSEEQTVCPAHTCCGRRNVPLALPLGSDESDRVWQTKRQTGNGIMVLFI